jgi:tetratricopeptide (TPR) repeat protein
MNALLTWMSALLLYAASAPGVAPQDENPFDLGVRLYQQGKYAESIAPLEQALNRYPEGSNILWNLGLASAAAGQPEKALTYWQRYHTLRSEDWQVLPRLIQTYQALGRIEPRDETLAELLRLRAQTQDPKFLEARWFCREQFMLDGRRVLAYQFFEPSGEWMQLYRLSVADPGGKEAFFISLGSYEMTNQLSRELGDIQADERVYHFDGYYPDGLHKTFGFLNAKTAPTYEAIRPTILKILKGEIRPVSSSQFK